MRIRMVCLEDGIVALGFRKMAAYVERLNPDTHVHYISTNSWRGLGNALLGRFGEEGILAPECINEIAQELSDADLVGFSSMTGYADLTKAIVQRLQELPSRPYLVWGGIHPIIHPEDAIQSGVDAICTGEGEFAFEEFLERFVAGRDVSDVRNFWFARDGAITRNGFLPLMTADLMDSLPYMKYRGTEWIYRVGKGFETVTLSDYLAASGLGYNTIWSIGCPFKCTYCGNTRFIENDAQYRQLRHPSARYIVEEVNQARRVAPHISTVCFHDDSFMAIPYPQLEELATLWREEVDLPFVVFGVIPNYVRREKLEVLTWAGLNRIRMGIQSGSQRILDFYERPSPPKKIEEAAAVCASFAPRYHIPPNYDIIMDNPVETREDVLETLELLYRLERPYTLNLYSLKVIPNTELERVMTEQGIDIDGINSNYNSVPPKWANLMAYLLAVWRPRRRLFERLLTNVEATSTPQPMYPVLGFVLRTLFLGKRGIDHLRFMDFSTIPGLPGYVAWRLGLVSLWRKLMTPRPERPRGAESPAESRRLPV